MADQLLAEREPGGALREWVARLTQYAMTKHGLAQAIRAAASPGSALFEETFVFTMRRVAHAAVIQPAGGAGLFVRCGSGRSDASGPGVCGFHGWSALFRWRGPRSSSA